jgi:hypothetical protein
MDRSVYSPAAEQRRVRSIHNGVYRLPRDVALNDLDRIFSHVASCGRSPQPSRLGL